MLELGLHLVEALEDHEGLLAPDDPLSGTQHGDHLARIAFKVDEIDFQ
ncbi:MAG: hypothetical protein ABW279_08205 [Acidimicrobiales bacterium]